MGYLKGFSRAKTLSQTSLEIYISQGASDNQSQALSSSFKFLLDNTFEIYHPSAKSELPELYSILLRLQVRSSHPILLLYIPAIYNLSLLFAPL